MTRGLFLLFHMPGLLKIEYFRRQIEYEVFQALQIEKINLDFLIDGASADRLSFQFH